MNELKQRILDHANRELRKEINMRLVKEKEEERKRREIEIANAQREEAKANGEPFDEGPQTE